MLDLCVELHVVDGSLWTVEVCLGTTMHGGVKFHRKYSNVLGGFVFSPLKLLLLVS